MAPLGQIPTGIFVANKSIYAEVSTHSIGGSDYWMFPAIKTGRIPHQFQDVAAVYRMS